MFAGVAARDAAGLLVPVPGTGNVSLLSHNSELQVTVKMETGTESKSHYGLRHNPPKPSTEPRGNPFSDDSRRYADLTVTVPIPFCSSSGEVAFAAIQQ